MKKLNKTLILMLLFSLFTILNAQFDYMTMLTYFWMSAAIFFLAYQTVTQENILLVKLFSTIVYLHIRELIKSWYRK